MGDRRPACPVRLRGRLASKQTGRCRTMQAPRSRRWSRSSSLPAGAATRYAGFVHERTRQGRTSRPRHLELDPQFTAGRTASRCRRTSTAPSQRTARRVRSGVPDIPFRPGRAFGQRIRDRHFAFARTAADVDCRQNVLVVDFRFVHDCLRQRLLRACWCDRCCTPRHPGPRTCPAIRSCTGGFQSRRRGHR